MKFRLLDNIQNKFMLEAEIRNTLNSNFNNVYETSDYFLFRCNICGDSKKSKYKKRAYIIKDSESWGFYCHNCGAGMGAMWWLKKYFPTNYSNFIKNCVKNKNREESPKDTTTYKNIKTKKEKSSNEAEIIKTFKSIKKFESAIEYCVKRKIPEDIYSKWFYCDSGRYKGRVIIPFYNKKGKIYYYQGRALERGVEPRYDSRQGSNLNSIYNYYLVNTDEWVTILEGPIDSIFVENSIALTGVHKNSNDDLMQRFTKKRYLFDNDADGKKRSLALLLNGEYVFNWKLFLKDYECDMVKDVNEFILKNKAGIEKLTFDIMGKYFTNKYFDKAFFL